uniref:Ig-like domain-containing protein n=1 Tax=Segatella hominis TaxID=2518605 RepID=UPI0040258080
MAKKDVVKYRCMNFGVCAKADANEVIEIPAIDTLGGTPPCPCCKQNTLQEIPEKTNKLPLIIGIAVGGLAVLGGGGYGVYSLLKSPTPKDIMLNHTEKTLMVGDMDTLRATIFPDGCEGTFTWKASKDGTLTVSNDGIVTAVKEGTGKVRVILEGVDGIKAVCEYTIKPKETDPGLEPVDSMKVDGLTTNTATATLKEGATQQLSATKAPNYSKAPITWETSNASVATVSAEGVVKAIKAGTAVITAKAGDKTATVAVAVEATKKPVRIVDPNPGSKKLGYGTFTGPIKNGQPNGSGTLRYTSSHLIDSRDPKGRVALPGDYVIGEWKNGKLIQGRWYNSVNNSKGAIIIGM